MPVLRNELETERGGHCSHADVSGVRHCRIFEIPPFFLSFLFSRSSADLKYCLLSSGTQRKTNSPLLSAMESVSQSLSDTPRFTGTARQEPKSEFPPYTTHVHTHNAFPYSARRIPRGEKGGGEFSISICHPPSFRQCLAPFYLLVERSEQIRRIPRPLV